MTIHVTTASAHPDMQRHIAEAHRLRSEALRKGFRNLVARMRSVVSRRPAGRGFARA